MSIDTPTTLITPTVADTGASGSYVDWPAVIAGIVLASAISLVLLTFGAAIGLGFVDFRAPETAAPIWIAIAAGSWLLWVQVSAFMAGGYLTGRLRKRHHDATPHESDIRDGAHGLLVWAGGLVVGAIIATGGIGAAANAVGSAASTAVTAASNAAEGEVTLDPNAYFVDTLFRGTTAAEPGDARAEAGRIILQAGVSPVPEADRTYLATLVARDTGLAEAEAQARVNEVLTAIDTAKAEAAEVAEAARRTTVVAAFLAAAALLIAAAGAWWAAGMGGRHRDENADFSPYFRRS